MKLSTLFSAMLNLQIQFNQRLDKEWPQRPQLIRNDKAAMVEEFGEYIGHTGYHWWKKTEVNANQALMELVDIWHFMMSFTLSMVDWEEGTQEELDRIVENLALHYEATWEHFLPISVEKDFASNLEEIQYLLGGSLNGLNSSEELRLAQTHLFVTLMAWDVSAEKFFAMYVGKNALNHFRQENGYKQGSYRKKWFDGREDNEHLFDIIEARSSDIASAEDPLKFVFDLLAERYN